MHRHLHTLHTTDALTCTTSWWIQYTNNIVGGLLSNQLRQNVLCFSTIELSIANLCTRTHTDCHPCWSPHTHTDCHPLLVTTHTHRLSPPAGHHTHTQTVTPAGHHTHTQTVTPAGHLYTHRLSPPAGHHTHKQTVTPAGHLYTHRLSPLLVTTHTHRLSPLLVTCTHTDCHPCWSPVHTQTVTPAGHLYDVVQLTVDLSIDFSVLDSLRNNLNPNDILD